MALQTTQDFSDLQVETDGWPTVSTDEQQRAETACRKLLASFKAGAEPPEKFAVCGLAGLGAGYSSLDASRPWLIYWILHSMELLGADLTAEEEESCLDTLKRCQNRDGGFGGGPGQLSHLAPTYAAVNALAILARDDACACIDRAGLLRWMHSLRTPDAGFRMHFDGEIDVRGAYCAASVATMVRLPLAALFAGTPAWIARLCAHHRPELRGDLVLVPRCQTFEGGVAAVPGAEAHGGYAFCGLAALHMLGQPQLLDLDLLTHWAVSRQMRLEGGFQGRPNKLVDGCYSFWVGAVFPLLHVGQPLYQTAALQEYVLVCGQAPMGGLRDKPGKSRDFYHTCYCLSGLASAQHAAASPPVVPHLDNVLHATHPLHNVLPAKVDRMIAYFVKQPSI